MPTVTSQDGTTIAFDKVGSGPAVILVNGAIAYRAFDPSLAHLAELLGQHFTVYNYDRRGRGVSSDTQPFAREREMEDLQALVEDAGGQAMVFGFSSGGVVSLDAAAVTPGMTKVGVYVILVDLPPGEGPKLHAHPYEEVFLIQEGCATYTIGSTTLEARAGQIAIVPAGIPHKFINSGSSRLRQVDIHHSPQFVTQWLED